MGIPKRHSLLGFFGSRARQTPGFVMERLLFLHFYFFPFGPQINGQEESSGMAKLYPSFPVLKMMHFPFQNPAADFKLQIAETCLPPTSQVPSSSQIQEAQACISVGLMMCDSRRGRERRILLQRNTIHALPGSTGLYPNRPGSSH